MAHYTEGDYDPHTIYTRTESSKGSSAQISFRVDPAIKGAISAIVQSKIVPGWDTTSTFGVDSLYHRVHWACHDADYAKLNDLPEVRLAREVAAIEARERKRQTQERIIEGYEAEELALARYSDALAIVKRRASDASHLITDPDLIDRFKRFLT